MRIRSKFLLLILCLFLASEKSALAISLDLHSHLIMQEGVGPLLWGDFDEPAAAKSWDSRFRTKMTEASLGPSGLKVIVISFYAHPVLTLGKVKERLLAEIERAENYVATHPNWVIASEPAEARAALAAGKRVFVFSLETAGGVLETAADQDLFIRDKKIRIVTFMHLSPDNLGRGVALWPGVGFFNSPLEYLEALWIRNRDRDPASQSSALLNPYGLSPHGKQVLVELVRRKVWIDLAHASDRAVADMIPVLDQSAQPALITHTRLREFGPNERATSNRALERVRKTRGLIGLVPTDDMTKPVPEEKAVILGLYQKECRRGLRAFAEEWRRAKRLLGDSGTVALGSDLNAPLRGLEGGCPSAPGEDLAFALRGFYLGEDLPKLSTFLQFHSVESASASEKAVTAFLDAWSRVRGH